MAILAECPMCHRKQKTKNKVCSCGEDLVKAKRSKKVKYWISYYLRGGKQRREAIGNSIEEARDAEGKRRCQKRENHIFDIKPDTKMTFQELSEWYLGLEKVKTLSSCWRIEISVNKLNSELGNLIVSKIKPVDLENYQAKRKKEGLADNTIDHEIGTAKAMIYKAFDNDIVSGDTLKTFKIIKKVLKRNSNVRTKILSLDLFEELMKYLPHHAKPIVATGFYTGMRSKEIFDLTWEKVDFKSGVIQLEAIDTKDNEPRTIPISEELLEIFSALPRAIHTDRVFLYKGKAVKSINKALKNACKKAGITYGRFMKGGFIFHDLRHTFNTNMRKAGVAESVIMEITGHSTREMFDRYNTVDIEDKRLAINQFETYLAQNSDQTIDQVTQKGHNKKLGGL